MRYAGGGSGQEDFDVEEMGIVRNELATDSHRRAWASLIGVDGEKDQLAAWATLALRSGSVERTSTAINRLALIAGPPGTGKTTLARNLAGVLADVLGSAVRVIEFAAHDVMSGEHGRTQRQAHRVLTEIVPDLAGTEFCVFVVDEVEALAMRREAVSLEANPVDVHRTTDAVITALDVLADRCPNVVTVATTNFPDLVDAAMSSRADIVLDIPLPNETAISEILRSTLSAWAAEFCDLNTLAADPGVDDVAAALRRAGLDARQVRKFILDVLSSDIALAADPNALRMPHLEKAATARVGSA